MPRSTYDFKAIEEKSLAPMAATDAEGRTDD